jgi:SAM-dependent methyltransferase
MKKYYEAYDDRYRQVHKENLHWFDENPSSIVLEMMKKYAVPRNGKILEIGCGEGRDARAVLRSGFALTATDISGEAVAYCKRIMPEFAQSFRVLDCLSDKLDEKFDFIYAIAVVHMLVPDKDRDGFYRFLREHLKPEGIALVCTMGDGEFEMQSDINRAFELQEREHESGAMLVAGTSCRMVSFPTFEAELKRNGLEIVETGITSALPDFNSLMFAVVKRA